MEGYKREKAEQNNVPCDCRLPFAHLLPLKLLVHLNNNYGINLLVYKWPA